MVRVTLQQIMDRSEELGLGVESGGVSPQMATRQSSRANAQIWSFAELKYVNEKLKDFQLSKSQSHHQVGLQQTVSETGTPHGWSSATHTVGEITTNTDEPGPIGPLKCQNGRHHLVAEDSNRTRISKKRPHDGQRLESLISTTTPIGFEGVSYAIRTNREATQVSQQDRFGTEAILDLTENIVRGIATRELVLQSELPLASVNKNDAIKPNGDRGREIQREFREHESTTTDIGTGNLFKHRKGHKRNVSSKSSANSEAPTTSDREMEVVCYMLARLREALDDGQDGPSMIIVRNSIANDGANTIANSQNLGSSPLQSSISLDDHTTEHEILMDDTPSNTITNDVGSNPNLLSSILPTPTSNNTQGSQLIKDVIILLRRKFEIRKRACSSCRPFRPTGLPITAGEMGVEWDRQVFVRERLSALFSPAAAATIAGNGGEDGERERKGVLEDIVGRVDKAGRIADWEEFVMRTSTTTMTTTRAAEGVEGERK